MSIVKFWRWGFEARVMFVWGVMLTQLGFMAIEDIQINYGQLMLVCVAATAAFSSFGFRVLSSSQGLVSIQVIYWLVSIYCMAELTDEGYLNWSTDLPFLLICLGVVVTAMGWVCFPREDAINSGCDRNK